MAYSIAPPQSERNTVSTPNGRIGSAGRSCRTRSISSYLMSRNSQNRPVPCPRDGRVATLSCVKSVLVVDDDHDSRQLLSLILPTGGYTVRTEGTADGA